MNFDDSYNADRDPGAFGDPPGGHTCDLDLLAERMREICEAGNGLSWVLPELAAAIVKYAGAAAVYGFRFGQDGKKYDLTLLDSSLKELPSSLEQWALTLGGRCAMTGKMQSESVLGAQSSTTQARMVAQLLSDRGIGIAGFWYNTNDFEEGNQRAALRMARSAMDRAATEQRLKQSESLVSQLAAITELISKVEAAGDLDQSSQVLADEMQRYLGARQVVVGRIPRDGGACKVSAISDRRRIADASEVTRLASAALQESIQRPGGNDSAQWPPADGDRHALQCHRQYAEQQRSTYLESGVLRDREGQAVAAWLISYDHAPAETQKRFVQALRRPAAVALDLLYRAHESSWQQSLTTVKESLADKKGQWIAIVAGCALVAMLVPLKYKVKTDCELHPTNRRFVAAPFDGRLEESLVRPGDTVHAGQILARMDGREVEWELNSLNADLHRATKERAGHVAKHESGKARVAIHEMERLKAQRDLLAHRAKNLDVRAPSDGIVVMGDLDKAEGVPLEIGQTLFEIAPLDNMVFELAIPEDDVRHVKPGDTVKMRLHAFPFESWHAEVERVHPRAELKGHENVFIAEVTLANEDSRLRPGMRGYAKIVTQRKTLGWILWHKPLAALQGWIGW